MTASRTCNGPGCAEPVHGRANYHSRTCQQRAYRLRKRRRERVRYMRRTRPSRRFWTGVGNLRRRRVWLVSRA